MDEFYNKDHAVLKIIKLNKRFLITVTFYL